MSLFVSLYCTCMILCYTSAQDIRKNPRLEYAYSLKRQHLEAKENDFTENDIRLSDDEKIVDNYLYYLKQNEFKATQHNFLPSRPIEEVLSQVQKSTVFRVLKSLPKGGNMHLHQNHILDKAKMLNMIFDSDLLNDLCVQMPNGSRGWNLGFYNTAPPGWEKAVSNLTKYSKENVLKHITLLGIMSETAKRRPTDSELRWIELGPAFGFAGSSLVMYEKYARMHMQALFESALSENVQYLEARFTPNSLYVLDDSEPEGHRFLDKKFNGESWLKLVREEVESFKKTHPEFIGYKDIIQLKRFQSSEVILNGLKQAIQLGKLFPDLVRGIDLVAEEDQGYSLLYFVDDFLETSPNNNIPFFFHTTETNWPDDLITSSMSDDPVGTLENVYDAIVLGSKRVGHGLGIIKHPYLMLEMKKRKIAVEANPVSNMLLGYVPDQRNHPAVTYLKAGVPVVLGADDPGTMGYNQFTTDWYEAFMAWGVGLIDMKLLAMNSLNFSTMNMTEKKTAMDLWNNAWNEFILRTKTEACASRNIAGPSAEIHSIFPTGCPEGVNATVFVYGRHFQSAVCSQIICKFGQKITNGEYFTNTQIKCAAPTSLRPDTDNEFSISLNNGTNFIYTGINFVVFPNVAPIIPLVIG